MARKSSMQRDLNLLFLERRKQNDHLDEKNRLDYFAHLCMTSSIHLQNLFPAVERKVGKEFTTISNRENLHPLREVSL